MIYSSGASLSTLFLLLSFICMCTPPLSLFIVLHVRSLYLSSCSLSFCSRTLRKTPGLRAPEVTVVQWAVVRISCRPRWTERCTRRGIVLFDCTLKHSEIFLRRTDKKFLSHLYCILNAVILLYFLSKCPTWNDAVIELLLKQSCQPSAHCNIDLVTTADEPNT